MQPHVALVCRFYGLHHSDQCYMNYYSFTSPGGMEGWVGLTGRPICLPTTRGGLGRLATWNLPASRWAATSNVEVGQTTYPVNRGRVGIVRGERESGARSKVTKRRGGRECNRRGAQGHYRGSIWIFVVRAPEFPVMPLLFWPVSLLSQGRFDDPIHPAHDHRSGTLQRKSVGQWPTS